jgi:cell shape-determining protein MreC
MQFGFSLSKKRALIAMLVIASFTSLLGTRVSDMLRMPASCLLMPVGDYVKAATSAFKSAMVHREAPALSPGQAVRLRKERDQWESIANAHIQGELHWWNMYRRVQKTKSAYGATLERCELIPARVIMGEGLPYGQSQTVSSGTIHGVERGMRVIDVLTDRSKALPDDAKMRAITDHSPVKGKPIAGSVLVGWVEAAGSFTARVRLVTDKRFKLEAILQRRIDPANPRKVTITTPQGPTETTLTRRNNRLIRVKISGDGERGMVTDAVPKAHNIRAGDWLWTIGRSVKLPTRMRVGIVVSVTQSSENPNFVTMQLVPAADLGMLRDIFIVRSLVSELPPSQGGN